MFISAVRFRSVGDVSWNGWKLTQGSGRYAQYQCVAGDRETMTKLARAMDFGITGSDPGAAFEVVIQLNDDSGRTWVIQRRPGLARYLRDGQALPPGEGELALAAALLDIDPDEAKSAQVSLKVNSFAIGFDDGRPALRPLGAPASQTQVFRKIVGYKIKDIATQLARTLALTELQNPKQLARLAMRLEPVYAQYREVDRLARESQSVEAAPVADSDMVVQQRLGQELELVEDLRLQAMPLLAPGAPSLKALKDALAKTEEDIGHICTELNMEVPAGRSEYRDFSKAIDALSRLEAHGKLLRASQGARKYCEQKIEAPYKAYLDHIKGEFDRNQALREELRQCHDQLTARLQRYQTQGNGASAGMPHSPSPSSSSSTIGKTWFERFKAKTQDEERQGSGEMRPPAELELAQKVVAFVLEKFESIAETMSRGLDGVHTQTDSALAALDQAHEELVRGLGRLRDQWLTQARDAGLPDDLDLPRMLKIVVAHGRLIALTDQREDLSERVRKHAGRLGRIEKLVVDWRALTGSQKQSDLTNTSILLQEARDIIRYFDAKRKKYDQLTSTVLTAKANSSLNSMLEGRRDRLSEYWKKVFAEESLPEIDLGHPKIGELFKAAGLIKALALVHGDAAEAVAEKIFDGRSEGAAASIYVVDDATRDHKTRLLFLAELEASQGLEPRILLLNDEAMAASLAPLGIGLATKLPQPSGASKNAASSRDQALREETMGPSTGPLDPTRRAVLPVGRGGPKGGPSPQIKDANALLQDRAQRALNILSGKARS